MERATVPLKFKSGEKNIRFPILAIRDLQVALGKPDVNALLACNFADANFLVEAIKHGLVGSTAAKDVKEAEKLCLDLMEPNYGELAEKVAKALKLALTGPEQESEENPQKGGLTTEDSSEPPLLTSATKSSGRSRSSKSQSASAA